MGIGEIALATFADHNLPDGVEPSLDSDATFDPVNFNYPHGTHLCALEIDTETGSVTMRKYTCVDDIGNVINPDRSSTLLNSRHYCAHRLPSSASITKIYTHSKLRK